MALLAPKQPAPSGTVCRAKYFYKALEFLTHRIKTLSQQERIDNDVLL